LSQSLWPGSFISATTTMIIQGVCITIKGKG
jgi:hypothetical protein